MQHNFHIYHKKEYLSFIPAAKRNEAKLVLATSFGIGCLIFFLMLIQHP